jgi:hypothetical protein
MRRFAQRLLGSFLMSFGQVESGRLLGRSLKNP